jgi:hypothetical protein
MTFTATRFPWGAGQVHHSHAAGAEPPEDGVSDHVARIVASRTLDLHMPHPSEFVPACPGVAVSSTPPML